MRFEGFGPPEANYSKLPHALIDELPHFDTKSELVVVLYVLRHTWGFQEFGLSKKITLDEFQYGRKRRDGTRLDRGVGMSKPAIISGLKRAIEHGFLEVEINDSDGARIRKKYQPKMLKGFTPDVKRLYPRSKGALHHTEKETPEKNQRNDIIEI